jgi:hypothetical protein
MQPSVLVKKELASRQLILNRPRRLNAIDMEMVDIIYPHLKVCFKKESFFKKRSSVLVMGIIRFSS